MTRAPLRTDLEGLAHAVQPLFPSGDALAVRDPRAPAAGLFPGEDSSRMTDKRRREFAAGRGAARAAMQALNLPPAAIAQGQDRAPVWPAGTTGSISHCASACLAAVAPSRALRAIGVDLEETDGLPAELWPDILTPLERSDPAMTPQRAKIIFSAKECAYKAQYPISQTLFDFHTLTIRLTQLGFIARFNCAVPGFSLGTELRGRYGVFGGLIVTTLCLDLPNTGM